MDLFSLHVYSDVVLLVLRVVIGIIFLLHGLMKLKLWKMKPSDQLPASKLYIMRLLSILEPIGALAVFAGFLTQIVAVCFGLIMLGAIGTKLGHKAPFIGHDKTGWELDLVILAACLVVLFLGGGLYSLDHLFFVVH